MAEKSGGLKARLEAARTKYPLLDHVLAMNEHYGKVLGNVLAGAVTYFGFLSFFPVLAIAFAVVGYVSARFPDARENLITAIEQLFPGIVSDSGEKGTISLQQIENNSATAGIIGFLTLLYSGLGWVSGLRLAMETVFELPKRAKPNFVVGKAIDFGALIVIGVFLIASVSVSGTLSSAAAKVLGLVNLDDTALGAPLLWVLGVVLGLAASTVLFYVIYQLLGRPPLPKKTLWQGALLGAIGFEILKFLVVNVIGALGGSAFAPLAIAVTLAVWINYFSRLVVYGAAWSQTAQREPRNASHARAASDAAAHQPDDAARAGALIGAAAVSTDRDPDEPPRGRLDPGSAIIGAVAGFLASLLFRRPR